MFIFLLLWVLLVSLRGRSNRHVRGEGDPTQAAGVVAEVGGRRRRLERRWWQLWWWRGFRRMVTMMKHSPDDLKLIEDAVRKAELKTCGEIVPIIYNKCSNTSFVLPVLFLFCFSFGTLFKTGIFLSITGRKPISSVGFSPAFYRSFQFFLSQRSAVQRLLVPKNRREKVIRDRAELEFYRCGIP